jgi:2-polyprenyl-3-methyl-5-hydroxy-6-metoxy-1,4-benzoquinol methylase
MAATSGGNIKARMKYLLAGMRHRFTRPAVCPCCGARGGKTVDQKYVYRLFRCENCGILYRHPSETQEEMNAFYQSEYAQAGLTTDLPDEKELNRLIETNFAGTVKDFSFLPVILKSLGIEPGARVLDYGANWGYSIYQLRRAGYQADGFEISEPRAAFGAKLGVEIKTSIMALSGGYDAVYSGHVLEHVPDPRASIREQIGLLGPQGYVIAHTPNGSEPRQHRSRDGFHKSWGQVHPVLLTDDFVVRNFGQMPAFVASETAPPSELAKWDRQSVNRAALDGGELFFVLRKQSA